MKRKIFSIVFFAASYMTAVAQTDSAYTLKQCIDYALENFVNVKNAKLDEYMAEARIGEVRGALLPQINGTAQLIDNPRLRRSYFSTDNPIVKAFNFDANGNPLPPPPPHQVIAEQNLFQLPTTGDAGATVNQVLFNNSTLVGLQANKAIREGARKIIIQNKIQTVETVTKAYYLILITRERLKLLDVNLARLDSNLRQTRAMRENGFAEKIDLYRAEVSYNNMLTERQKTENSYILSIIYLKFNMGMQVGNSFNISGNIADLDNAINEISSSPQADYKKRIEYSLLETQRVGNYLQLKNTQGGYLPTLSAFGTVGYYAAERNPGKLFSQGQFFSYALYGVTLNVPIFDGFTKKYQVQQRRLDIKKTDNNMFNLKNKIDMEVQQSSITLNNNLKTLSAQKRNLDLSAEVARIANIKYKEGVGSNLEVTSAETDYRTAQTNYYSALYDVIVGNVDYQKSLGTLYTE